MIANVVIFVVFLHIGPPIINAASEHILLSCGSKEQNSTVDGRTWIGDATTNLSPDFSISVSAVEFRNPNVTVMSPVPYHNARVIQAEFSYILPVSAGQKILRLYFYPNTTYSSNVDVTELFDATKSFFNVTANQYTLLNNFNALSFIEAGWPSPYYVKEFIINVRQSDLSLNVTFVPSPESFAFINGIEVLSLPENLYMGSHDLSKKRLIFVNAPTNQFNMDQANTAFEAMYRVAMGGKPVDRLDDTAGLFREWINDDVFLISEGKGDPISNDSISLTYTPDTPDYSAPAVVYKTARVARENLTWTFLVDSGYVYLLRLHFCDFLPSSFFNGGQRVLIDGMEAEVVDIVNFTGGIGIPMFRDYVVFMANPTGDGRSKVYLNLDLSPDRRPGPLYIGVFLNGVEVFKLSTTDGYLAGVNPI